MVLKYGPERNNNQRKWIFGNGQQEDREQITNERIKEIMGIQETNTRNTQLYAIKSSLMQNKTRFSKNSKWKSARLPQTARRRNSDQKNQPDE